MDTQSEHNPSSERVHIPVDRVMIEGDLLLSPSARAVIVCPEGIGDEVIRSASHGLAESLQNPQFATLSIRLLTKQEADLDARTEAMRFDVDLLSRRLTAVTWWLKDQSQTAKLPIGYFAVSTAAAAALLSAADTSELVDAIVAVDGRPDLAGTALNQVIAPTLLVVTQGGRELLQHNEAALAALSAEKKLECVPGMQSLTAADGIGRVLEFTKSWFKTYLLGDRGETRAA